MHGLNGERGLIPAVLHVLRTADALPFGDGVVGNQSLAHGMVHDIGEGNQFHFNNAFPVVWINGFFLFQLEFGLNLSFAMQFVPEQN